MKKSDFFIVEAPKCGTSSLRFYLEQHPDIFISNPNEPLFFCPDITSSKIDTVENYLKLFEAGKDKICGEKSTRYLFSEVAPQKIYAFNPDAKIIIILRDPISFMHSWHSELLMWFVEDIDDFESALAAEQYRKNGERIPKTCNAPKQLLYREFAKFSIHIERYLSVFKKDQIYFLILDELKEDPSRYYKDLLDFLGVNSSFRPNFEVQNKNKKYEVT